MPQKITDSAKQMLAKHNLTLIQFLNWYTQGKIEGQIVYTLEDVEKFIFENQDLTEFARLFGVSEFEFNSVF